MVTIEQIDTNSASQVNEFVKFHYQLYKDVPQWTPPFISDVKIMLNKQKHPFYEHSEGDFFVAKDGNEIVARLGVMENKLYNKEHDKKTAQFYLFDSIDNIDVVKPLFDRGFEWAKTRGLDTIIGPKGLSAFDGYGVLIEGFEHHQMMNMMNYNFDYYPKLLEQMGFEKEVDFVSCYLHPEKFILPEKVNMVAEKLLQKGRFKVLRFDSRKEVKKWANQIGAAYNKAFKNNWEYYPFTPKEIDFIVQTLISSIMPKFIKIITYDDEVVGFALGFPDVSKAMVRHKGRITPLGVADLLITLKRTNWISMNGIGILPEYHGMGGLAVLYSEMEKTLNDSNQFQHGELTQVAETAVQMRKELENLGGVPYKNHRVYHRSI